MAPGQEAPFIRHLPLMCRLSCLLLHCRIEHQDARVALTSLHARSLFVEPLSHLRNGFSASTCYLAGEFMTFKLIVIIKILQHPLGTSHHQ